MKLYATTTSERASKGQGGKWLDIEVKNENNKVIFFAEIRVTENIGKITAGTLTGNDDKKIEWLGEIVQSKGKKEKDEEGELCKDCGHITQSRILKCDQGHLYCEKCGVDPCDIPF